MPIFKGQNHHELPGNALYLTPHEAQVMDLLVSPAQLNVTWGNVAGSEELISSI
jgi:hypothetical protein